MEKTLRSCVENSALLRNIRHGARYPFLALYETKIEILMKLSLFHMNSLPCGKMVYRKCTAARFSTSKTNYGFSKHSVGLPKTKACSQSKNDGLRDFLVSFASGQKKLVLRRGRNLSPKNHPKGALI